MHYWTKRWLYIIIFLVLGYSDTTISEKSSAIDLSNYENFVDLTPMDIAVKELEVRFFRNTGLGDPRTYTGAFSQAGYNLYSVARDLVSILYFVARHPHTSVQAINHFATKTTKSVHDFSKLTEQERIEYTTKFVNTFENYIADTWDKTTGPEITKSIVAFGLESVALVALGKLFKLSSEKVRALMKDSTIIHDAQTARIAKNIRTLNCPWSNALTLAEIELKLKNTNPLHQINWNTLEKFTEGLIKQGGVKGLESRNSCLAKIFQFGHDPKHAKLVKGSIAEMQAGVAFMEKGAILHEHGIKITYGSQASEIDWLVKLPGNTRLYAVEVKDWRVWVKYWKGLKRKIKGQRQPDIFAENIFELITDQLKVQLPWAKEQGYGYLFYSNFRLRPDVKIRFMWRGIGHVWHNPHLFEKHPFAAAAFARIIAGNKPDFAQPQLAFSVSFDEQEPAPAFTINENSAEYEQDESLKKTFSTLFEGSFRFKEQGVPQNAHEENLKKRFKQIFEQSSEEFFEDDYLSQFNTEQKAFDHDQEKFKRSFQERLKEESNRWHSHYRKHAFEPPKKEDSPSYNEWRILDGLTMVFGGTVAYTFSSSLASSWSISGTIVFLTEKGLLDVLLTAPVFYGVLAASGLFASYRLYSWLATPDSLPDLKHYPDIRFIDSRIIDCNAYSLLPALNRIERYDRKQSASLKSCVRIPKQIRKSPFFEIKGYIAPFWLYDTQKEVEFCATPAQEALKKLAIPVRLDVIPAVSTAKLIDDLPITFREAAKKLLNESMENIVAFIENARNRVDLLSNRIIQDRAKLDQEIELFIKRLADCSGTTEADDIINIDEEYVKPAFIKLYDSAARAQLCIALLSLEESILQQKESVVKKLLQVQLPALLKHSGDVDESILKRRSAAIESMAEDDYQLSTKRYSKDITLHGSAIQHQLYEEIRVIMKTMAAVNENAETKSIKDFCIALKSLAHDSAYYNSVGYVMRSMLLNDTVFVLLEYLADIQNSGGESNHFTRATRAIANLVDQCVPGIMQQPALLDASGRRQSTTKNNQQIHNFGNRLLKALDGLKKPAQKNAIVFEPEEPLKGLKLLIKKSMAELKNNQNSVGVLLYGVEQTLYHIHQIEPPQYASEASISNQNVIL